MFNSLKSENIFLNHFIFSFLGYSILFGSIVIFWIFQLNKNINRIENLCLLNSSPATVYTSKGDDWDKDCLENNFSGADPVEYIYYFRNYPSALEELSEIKSFAIYKELVAGELTKRPLYGPFSALLTLILGGLLKISFPKRMLVILAAYASLNALLLYYLLMKMRIKKITAGFITIVANFGYAWLSIFSIPESYSLTCVGLILVLISGYHLSKSPDDPFWKKRLLHSLIVGFATWLYPPLAGGAFFVLHPERSFKKNSTALVMAVALIVFIAAMPQFAYYGTLENQVEYAQQWGEISNLSNINNWVNVLFGFIFYTGIAPIADFLTYSGGIDWLNSTNNLTNILVIFMAWVIGIVLIMRFLKSGPAYLLVAPGLWILVLWIYHVYFNPTEVMLYSSVPWGLIIYGLSLAIREIDIEPRQSIKVQAGLIVVSLGLILINWPVVFG